MADIDETLSTESATSSEESFSADSDISVGVRFTDDVSVHPQVFFERKPSVTITADHDSWLPIHVFNAEDFVVDGTIQDMICHVVDASAEYRFRLQYIKTGEAVDVFAVQ